MEIHTVEITPEGTEDTAKLTVYLLDDSEKIPIHTRGLVLVCPGGAYGWTSDREGEMVAMQYLAHGYHAAVLRYTTPPTDAFVPVKQLAMSMAHIRKHHEEWKVDPKRIVPLGFSAGGHLVATLGVKWHDTQLNEELHTDPHDIEPNGIMLAYPVITAGEYAHKQSFENLCGKPFDEIPDEIKEQFSPELHIDSDYMPEVFLWNTYPDQSVPAMNSLLFVQSCMRAGVPVEYHMFRYGEHGISLGNALTARSEGGGEEPYCSIWMDLSLSWLENR